ncbi:hypothetical protein [Niabella hibiscisoli]|uniref:hypothetical protein n=1 Tax=Niabella hibiscisoli TaxID=1825928 RepID=UPI001F0E6BD5|nr:hypothetical protein [Niabella hibiscisoli]MCH5715453.1 hypothetical protein [Niabella hibiscisoli]
MISFQIIRSSVFRGYFCFRNNFSFTSYGAKKTSSRGTEIVTQYFAFIDQHLADLLEDRVDDMMTITQIAQHLFIAPGHLTNT